MIRPLIIFLTVVVIIAVVVGAVSLKHVPAGFEALRVSHGGDLTPYRSGFHVVKPGYADYLLYPVGSREYRCPADGTMPVVTMDGEEIDVAFTVMVTVPAGSAAKLYERFSEDFEPALNRVVSAAAEMEAATSSSRGDKDRYLDAVRNEVRDQLSDVGVTVTSVELLVWGGQAVSGEPAPGQESVAAAPPVKLIVVGVDGGDWLNIEPLVDAGSLPNFKKLLEKGATGPLRSMEPLLSPLLWTTMATGKYPEDHGVLNFTIADEETGKKVPITRYYRKVDAFWNMLGDYGRRVCVAGWLATDPAESVNGLMVTDKVGYLAYAPESDAATVQAQSIFPPGRAAEIAKLVTHADDVTYEEMERFMHISKDEFLAHRDIEYDPRDSINALIMLYATTRTYADIALHVLETDHPDVLAVYFELVDATSHLFMLQSAPRMSDVSADDYAKFKDAVDQAYMVQDEILGDIMTAMDDSTVLMVISDHGFKSGTSRLKNRPEIWAGNAAHWHRLDGIVAFYGPGVKKGFDIGGASILDVAPTILALQGLPRAGDMPGKALSQAFEPALQAKFNTATVASLERDRPDETAPDRAGGAAASEETMKKLEALGYISPDNADAHNNLGQRYQQRGEFEKAIEEYKQAIAMRADFHAAYNNLAVCYGKLKRYDEAEAALEKAIELKPSDYYAMNNLAVMYIENRRFDRALAFARRCVQTEPGYVNGRVTLGSVLAMTGDYEGAETQFREALKLDPENKSARTNLQRLEQHRQQNQ